MLLPLVHLELEFCLCIKGFSPFICFFERVSVFRLYGKGLCVAPLFRVFKDSATLFRNVRWLFLVPLLFLCWRNALVVVPDTRKLRFWRFFFLFQEWKIVTCLWRCSFVPYVKMFLWFSSLECYFLLWLCSFVPYVKCSCAFVPWIVTFFCGAVFLCSVCENYPCIVLFLCAWLGNVCLFGCEVVTLLR